MFCIYNTGNERLFMSIMQCLMKKWRKFLINFNEVYHLVTYLRKHLYNLITLNETSTHINSCAGKHGIL